jgi:hypothetical protein
LESARQNRSCRETAEKVPATERKASQTSPMLNQLKIHRQILYDLTALHLEPMKGLYERLAYLASMRDPGTGIYTHKSLSLQYPADRVSEALERCHEEIFEKLLESPLATLEQDLRRYFEAMAGQEKVEAEACQSLTESWIPQQSPNYLRELYCSNQSALCALLQENRSKAR